MRRCLLLVACLLTVGVLSPVEAAEPLRLNHLQARGTHNSTHRDPDGERAGVIRQWQYSHPPIEAQLEDQDVRQLELDVHWNAARGVFEVYHVWLFDDRTTCSLLSECLDQIERWSDAHPTHHPILVMIEPKDGPLEDEDPFTRPLDADAYNALDATLRGFPRVLEPGDVRVPGRTLRDSILTQGWPAIDDVRGEVLYLLDGDDHTEDYLSSTNGQPAMFVQVGEKHDWAAFVSRFGTATEAKYVRMRRLVAAGFMVRDLIGSDATAAKEAGAHFISTDFPEEVELSKHPHAPSRCNPVSAGAGCADVRIERHLAHDYESPTHPGDGEDQVVHEKADRLVGGTICSATRGATCPVLPQS